RIGLIADYYERDVDPEVAAVFRHAVETLREIGAEIIEIDLPEVQSGRIANAAADLLVYEFNLVFGATYKAIAGAELVGPIVHSDMAKAARIGAEKYEEALSVRKALIEKFQLLFT